MMSECLESLDEVSESKSLMTYLPLKKRGEKRGFFVCLFLFCF